MVSEANWLEMMPSTVTVYAKSSEDAYGKMAYTGAGTGYRCRVQKTGKAIKTETNRDVYEDGIVIFRDPVTLTTDSKIVLPDGSSPLIVSVRYYDDEDGAHHTTVSFGKV